MKTIFLYIKTFFEKDHFNITTMILLCIFGVFVNKAAKVEKELMTINIIVNSLSTYVALKNFLYFNRLIMKDKSQNDKKDN